MILCPLCDGQGIIYKAKIVSKDTQIYICEECDAMWITVNICADNCINFKKFMQGLGLKGLWSELTDVDVL